MQWQRLGNIFNPFDFFKEDDRAGFAQSPQTLVFDDFVRIYFSTRKKDTNGKFLSHIAYVDMDLDLSTILDVSKHTVIPLGSLGAFDEHGIFPINPVNIDGKIMAYTCGWSRRVSVSVETSTGLAYSDDGGKTFNKVGNGPIFSSSLNEPFLVGDSFVKKIDGKFYMWYIYGTNWLHHPEEQQPARVYKIAQAYSHNGIEWIRDGKCIISDVIDENECQALPTVAWHNNRYHMFFCYRHAAGFRNMPGKGYRLGYAHSNDLVNWTRDDSLGNMPLASTGWDSEMMCYPHLFQCKGNLYLLYNGNEFGKCGFGIARLLNE